MREVFLISADRGANMSGEVSERPEDVTSSQSWLCYWNLAVVMGKKGHIYTHSFLISDYFVKHRVCVNFFLMDSI